MSDELLMSELKEAVRHMASFCCDAISFAMQDVLLSDATLGERAIEAERQSDTAEQMVRALCMRILLKPLEPLELSFVSGSLKVAADMERIGDMGEDIAKLLTKTRTVDLASFNTHIAAMADCVIRMVSLGTQSFIKQDSQLAHEVCSMDDEADGLFSELKADIVDAMIESAARGNREFAESALASLMIAKYLERVGDHAENIAQATLALAKGA